MENFTIVEKAWSLSADLYIAEFQEQTYSSYSRLPH